MSLPLLALVRLRADDHQTEGVGVGAIGTVAEVFDGAYEVEFSDPADGTTLALLTLPDEALEQVPPDGLSRQVSG